LEIDFLGTIIEGRKGLGLHLYTQPLNRPPPAPRALRVLTDKFCYIRSCTCRNV